MFKTHFSAHSERALSILRIMAGLLFLAHGTQKILGFPEAQWEVPLYSMFWFAGILELIGGTMIVLGVFTRPVAFILSGQMAFAYFLSHAGKSFFPVLNGGDAAILFSFVFLYLAFSGPGAWSIDKLAGRE